MSVAEMLRRCRPWPGRLAIFALVFAAVGEADFRLRPHERRLEFEVDDTLYYRLAPGQSGYLWLAQLSTKSPTITINELGMRGRYQDPSRHRHVVLAVGSSSGLGAGVRDEETWTARIEAALRARGLDAVVLNASTPGWGPFQHAAYLERHAVQLDPGVMLVLVSAGDLNFLPMTSEERKRQFLAEARARKRILDLSPFLAFSLRKAEVLLTRNLNRLRETSKSLRRALKPAPAAARGGPDLAAFRRRVQRHRPFWQRIDALSRERAIPVVFLVLNPAASETGGELVRVLGDVTAGNPGASVVELDARASGALSQRDPRGWYLKTLTIPNDGHPNVRYHQIMADTVTPVLEALLAPK